MECARFDEFDACAAALLRWEIEAVQIDRGPFTAELIQAASPTALVSEITFGRALHQRGEPPRRMRTLGVPADSSQRIFFRDHWTHGDQLMFFPNGSEMDSVSVSGFHVFSVSFSEDDLSEASLALGGADFEGLLAGREVVDCAPADMQSVRHTIREFVESARREDVFAPPECSKPDRGVDLLQKIVEILTLDQDPYPSEPSCTREFALRRSLAMIDGSARKSLAIADLCRAAGVSRRTLEYAFRERFGISPKSYLLARRLDGVRAELRQDGGEPSITRIANEWGFDHLSRFAAFYKRQYGELPSETVRGIRSSG